MDAAGKNNFRDNLHDGLVGVVRMGFGILREGVGRGVLGG